MSVIFTILTWCCAWTWDILPHSMYQIFDFRVTLTNKVYALPLVAENC